MQRYLREGVLAYEFVWAESATAFPDREKFRPPWPHLSVLSRRAKRRRSWRPKLATVTLRGGQRIRISTKFLSGAHALKAQLAATAAVIAGIPLALRLLDPVIGVPEPQGDLVDVPGGLEHGDGAAMTELVRRHGAFAQRGDNSSLQCGRVCRGSTRCALVLKAILGLLFRITAGYAV
jgi:hypothetical protein